MKKITLLMAGMAALALSSCSDDKEPVYTPLNDKVPTFELNTPPFASQELVLGEGANDMLTLSVYQQPDYGFNASVNYSLLVGLTPEALDLETIAQNEKDGKVVEMTSDKASSPVMTFRQTQLAEALCTLHGFTADLDNYQDLPAAPVYVRAKSQLKGVEGSQGYSNLVKFDSVKFFKAFKTKAKLYLVGSFQTPNSWDPSADPATTNPVLEETAVGSNVYFASFDMPAGTQAFRFLKELVGWGDKSVQYGAGPDDMTDIPTTLTDGVYEGSVTNPGQSNWSIDWAGGEISMTVDLNAMTIKIEAGGGSAPVVTSSLFMVGNNSGWAAPDESSADIYANWKLTDNGDQVYKATWTIAADQVNEEGALYFRFYDVLCGWSGTAKYAAAEADGDNVNVTAGTEYPCVAGSGCFVIADAAGKTITFTVDGNTNKFSYTE